MITALRNQGLNNSRYPAFSSRLLTTSLLIASNDSSLDSGLSIRDRTANPSDSLPRLISHRGVSGMYSIPTNKTIAGITPT